MFLLNRLYYMFPRFYNYYSVPNLNKHSLLSIVVLHMYNNYFSSHEPWVADSESVQDKGVLTVLVLLVVET